MSKPMRVLQVDLDKRTYPIYIGRGLLHQQSILKQHLSYGQILLVTNTTVGPLHAAHLQPYLAQSIQNILELPDGETHKTLATAELIFERLLQLRYARDCCILALGGGVIGDLAGFVAACYQRGVDFIQIPTTLLAQVDSSVGGKTAVNHPLGKNMIGAFHQPRAVIADLATLDTLPDRELRAGLAEVIKYGLIVDAEFFAWLEEHIEQLLRRDEAALMHAVEVSCRTKAAIVAADEFEQDQRALLNLGHTFGHAIETGLGYGEWLHGEAVAVGMLMAADLSARAGWLEPTAVARLRRLLERAGLPVRAPALDAQQFLALMSLDKKVRAGQLRLVLLHAIGQAIVSSDYEPALLQATLTEFPRVA